MPLTGWMFSLFLRCRRVYMCGSLLSLPLRNPCAWCTMVCLRQVYAQAQGECGYRHGTPVKTCGMLDAPKEISGWGNFGGGWESGQRCRCQRPASHCGSSLARQCTDVDSCRQVYGAYRNYM